MMEESTRFLSLSGLSGIFAGVFAIAGALIAYFLILKNGSIHYDEYFRSLSEKETQALRWQLIADAVCVLVLSLYFHSIFHFNKAKREGKNFWSPVSKNLLINMLIPLDHRRYFYNCTPDSESYTTYCSRITHLLWPGTCKCRQIHIWMRFFTLEFLKLLPVLFQHFSRAGVSFSGFLALEYSTLFTDWSCTENTRHERSYCQHK